MPSIGEQGWGNLVSNNFEIIDNAIGSGTRILSISISPSTITTSNFSNYASYDGNNVYIASFRGNITFESIPQPSHSCRLMIIVVNGNATISGNINTYPTTLQSETPPNSPSNNTYGNGIAFSNFSSCTLTYIANANNSQLTMNYNDYLTFLGKRYILSIPHAIAEGGTSSGNNGTAGTASNTCNGGGGGSSSYRGGRGCIFGQYSGGNRYGYGYGYGDGSMSYKYRCGLIIFVVGNLTINSTIIQNGGNSGNGNGGYGGGAWHSGGGGAPVFIYYTGSYRNNGSINTAGGNGNNDGGGGNGGAGGIKVTKISI